MNCYFCNKKIIHLCAIYGDSYACNSCIHDTQEIDQNISQKLSMIKTKNRNNVNNELSKEYIRALLISQQYKCHVCNIILMIGG